MARAVVWKGAFIRATMPATMIEPETRWGHRVHEASTRIGSGACRGACIFLGKMTGEVPCRCVSEGCLHEHA